MIYFNFEVFLIMLVLLIINNIIIIYKHLLTTNNCLTVELIRQEIVTEFMQIIAISS